MWEINKYVEINEYAPKEQRVKDEIKMEIRKYVWVN
jgi:hypothetical protein